MGRPTNDAKVKTARGEGHGEGAEQVLIPQQDNTRIVYLHGEVSEHSITAVIAQLLYLAGVSTAPIHLVVSTYGGSVDEMFSLYDTIKFLPCPVHTVALGKVMSAGVLLLASGVKGKRLMGASARIMMHAVSAGNVGNLFEVENQTKELRRLHELMVTALAKETRMTRAQVEKIMNSKVDHYMTATEALRYGIIDKIIGIDK